MLDDRGSFDSFGTSDASHSCDPPDLRAPLDAAKAPACVERLPPLPSLPFDPAALDLDALDAEIGRLAAHLHAATWRLIVLIGEFDRRQAYGEANPQGLLTTAHWLNWRCGIAIGAAREKVRVARALPALPLISRAFANGRLSYSKVRALTRVARPDNEADLLDIALNATAAHVERCVGHYRRVESAMTPMVAREHVARRSLEGWWQDDGSFAIRALLSPEQGALVQAAIDTALEPPVSEARRGSEGEPDRAQSRIDALVRICEAYLAGSRTESRTADRYQVRVSVPLEALAGHGPAGADEPEPDAAGPVAVLDDGRPLASSTLRRLCCDGTLVALVEDAHGQPLASGARTRTVPAALRRAVERRDGGCRFPGCTRSRFVDAHHVRHWADGGRTVLANLVSLCRVHHTAVHEEGFQVEALDGGRRFAFRHPGGWLLEGTGDGHLRGDVDELIVGNEQTGIAIGRDATDPAFAGGRVDWDHILFVLFQPAKFRRRGEAPASETSWTIAARCRTPSQAPADPRTARAGDAPPPTARGAPHARRPAPAAAPPSHRRARGSPRAAAR